MTGHGMLFGVEVFGLQPRMPSCIILEAVGGCIYDKEEWYFRFDLSGLCQHTETVPASVGAYVLLSFLWYYPWS